MSDRGGGGCGKCSDLVLLRNEIPRKGTETFFCLRESFYNWEMWIRKWDTPEGDGNTTYFNFRCIQTRQSRNAISRQGTQSLPPTCAHARFPVWNTQSSKSPKTIWPWIRRSLRAFSMIHAFSVEFLKSRLFYSQSYGMMKSNMNQSSCKHDCMRWDDGSWLQGMTGRRDGLWCRTRK